MSNSFNIYAVKNVQYNFTTNPVCYVNKTTLDTSPGPDAFEYVVPVQVSSISFSVLLTSGANRALSTPSALAVETPQILGEVTDPSGVDIPGVASVVSDPCFMSSRYTFTNPISAGTSLRFKLNATDVSTVNSKASVNIAFNVE